MHQPCCAHYIHQVVCYAHYTPCRLTVTDSQGLSSSRSAYITVQPAKDDPPTADAGGSPHSIRLPQSEVTLFANKSKDDHGIVKYEWVQQNPTEDDPINIEVCAGLGGRGKGITQVKGEECNFVNCSPVGSLGCAVAQLTSCTYVLCTVCVRPVCCKGCQTSYCISTTVLA